ncbi:uncharacterized protein BO87DRAFT_315555 [Aspergillus neoniger CBS 115656]|uniref:Uncharacterized protein n=1 Tax=Aspergillus neoniger (strain CBS 115656) TaxID=1448310 RepID=A0A318YAB9_ASPNB|nr:hypothetical protein BO87DRAFT_315555 [Aspergillus neoniger CBS 115656]PYH31266.1 hypothetical protein BO87DRAFT_315555 [Aspergillus neoniger CBS 115656]
MPKNIHIMRLYCALCVDHPTAGEQIFSLDEDNFTLETVPNCDITDCIHCHTNPKPLIWIHTRCYQLLMASYEPGDKPSFVEIQKYALATRELYLKIYPECGNPGTVLEGLSSQRAACMFPESFMQNFFGKLPPEIRRRVAELVAPCWYLTILGEVCRLIDYMRENEEEQEDVIDLTEDLWVSRILCQDHSYLAQLSNKPLKINEGTDVFHIQLPQTIHRIIISSDHLGVRGIQFLDHDTTPTEDQSPWYEINIVEDSHPKLQVIDHCLLVKMVTLNREEGTLSKSLTWSSPFVPALDQLKYAHSTLVLRGKLHYLDLGPPVRGIIVVYS